MALANYTSTALRSASGSIEIVADATITVRVASTGNLASLFEDRDGLTPLTNPFDADSLGRFSFYVEGGAHNIEVEDGQGSTLLLPYQAIGTAGEHDTGVAAEQIPPNEDFDVTSGDIVGTDIPGAVGRGAIVEQGANSDGHYVKWQSGLMMTRTRFNLEQSGTSTNRLVAPGTVHLPHDFADTASMFPVMSVPLNSSDAWTDVSPVEARCFGPSQRGGTGIFTISDIGCTLYTDSGAVSGTSLVEGCVLVVWGNWK